MLKTSSRHVLKTSSRRLEDQQIFAGKDFDARLLKIDKKSYKNIGIYNIGYITKKKIDDCQNIYIMNPLYLIVANASGYIEEKDLNTLYLNIDHAGGYIKEKGVNKYFVFLTLQIKIKSY